MHQNKNHTSTFITSMNPPKELLITSYNNEHLYPSFHPSLHSCPLISSSPRPFIPSSVRPFILSSFRPFVLHLHPFSHIPSLISLLSHPSFHIPPFASLLLHPSSHTPPLAPLLLHPSSCTPPLTPLLSHLFSRVPSLASLLLQPFSCIFSLFFSYHEGVCLDQHFFHISLLVPGKITSKIIH
jgi:hypothetical protein